jgi:hypothetical protein
MEKFDQDSHAEREATTEAPKVNENELFIFADQSGSMSGQPFRAVQEACRQIAEKIFGANGADNSFKKVHL